jgi:hypothetical protein
MSFRGLAMPLALIIVLLDITLVYHACKAGRARPWAFIILMVPGVGGLAYIAVELIPEIFSSPDAKRARRRIANKLDPEKQYRALCDQLQMTDTVANRAALAAECLEVARFEEARQHYAHIQTMQSGDDPVYALGEAKAEFGLRQYADVIATLDALRSRWPNFESAEGHLLYARALTESGRSNEALEELEALSHYYPGADARVRYGLLLDQQGRKAEARVVFTELLIQMNRAPKYLRNMQKDWLSIAEKYLAA